MFQIYQYYTINNHDSHHKWKLEAGGWKEIRNTETKFSVASVKHRSLVISLLNL
jgi:hypothetical protein